MAEQSVNLTEAERQAALAAVELVTGQLQDVLPAVRSLREKLSKAMNEERLRAALQAVLPWADTYEDHMGDSDFERREAAIRFAERVLAGDESITLDSAREQIRAEHAAAAAKGPRIVIRGQDT